MSEEEVKTEVPEVEQKARSMGWVPKDEFRGNAEKWRPADEFVQRGENLMPILKERLEKQTREISEMKETMQQMHGYFQKAETVAEQRGWEKAIADLSAKQREAAESADVEAFDKLEAKRQELLAAPPQPKPQQQGPSAEFKKFSDRNDWYMSDEEMTLYADAIGMQYAGKNRGATETEVFAEVEKKVRNRFPEKFTNPRREGASAVEGATPATKKSGKTFDDLPEEHKKTYFRFEKEIKAKGGKFTKEDYLRNYSW